MQLCILSQTFICQDATYTKIAIFSLFQGWEMPYAGQNVNSFKKSSIPDPADIGEKKACGFRETFFALMQCVSQKILTE